NKRMSGQITIVEARERLHARLWAEQPSDFSGDAMRTIFERRLWLALQEQRIHVRDESRMLTRRDLTEPLRRIAFTKSPALDIADKPEFDEWIATVVPLASLPNKSYLTAIEATAFLAHGAFLTSDDLCAVEYDDLTSDGPTLDQIDEAQNV